MRGIRGCYMCYTEDRTYHHGEGIIIYNARMELYTFCYIM